MLASPPRRRRRSWSGTGCCIAGTNSPSAARAPPRASYRPAAQGSSPDAIGSAVGRWPEKPRGRGSAADHRRAGCAPRSAGRSPTTFRGRLTRLGQPAARQPAPAPLPRSPGYRPGPGSGRENRARSRRRRWRSARDVGFPRELLPPTATSGPPTRPRARGRHRTSGGRRRFVLAARPCGQHLQVLVQLHRIGVDDFALPSLRQAQGQGGTCRLPLAQRSARCEAPANLGPCSFPSRSLRRTSTPCSRHSRPLSKRSQPPGVRSRRRCNSARARPTSSSKPMTRNHCEPRRAATWTARWSISVFSPQRGAGSVSCWRTWIPPSSAANALTNSPTSPASRPRSPPSPPGPWLGRSASNPLWRGGPQCWRDCR